MPETDPDYVPPPIDGDTLLAVTGIRHILAKETRRITVADKERTEGLPREIRRSCARFLDEDHGEQRVPRSRPFDYGWVLDHITDIIDDDGNGKVVLNVVETQRLAKSFRPEDSTLAAEYLAAASRVIPYLYGILPIRTETTMVTTTNYDPSDTEIARFRRAYDVADDPMVVMRDLELGTLVSDQITHLAALWPRIYTEIKGRMQLQMGAELARKKSWRLNYRKDRLVQVLFQATTWNAQLAQDLQASFANQPKPPQGPPPAKGGSKAATATQTQTAAVAEGKV